jgi:organic radical activating enzyme
MVEDFDIVVDQYNVSPKLAHSMNIEAKRYKPIVLRRFAKDEKAWFKFVITYPGDLHEVDEMVLHQGIPSNRIMVMPEGNSVNGNLESARNFEAAAISRGYGVSFRTHILLWPRVNRGK